MMGGGWADGVNSGTSALYVALHALDPEPFTEVIVGAVTDNGGMMPIPLLGCIPVVADSMPGSYNTGPEQIEPLISDLTSAIVVAHIAGEPADMPGIMELARAHNLPVIEDCSQAHGARLHGKYLGTFGDLACFSTMFGKHHCTGGQGGLVYCPDEEMYWRVRRAADRGKPLGLEPGSSNCQASLNLNLNDIGATIGRVQLRKLPDIVSRRRALVERFSAAIRDLPTVDIPPLIEGAAASYWFLRLQFQAEEALCTKDDYCAALREEGLAVSLNYRAALPHRAEWFVNRRVFGTSGFPWTSPQYKGDAEREFPCPNAEEVMDTNFQISVVESWGEQEVEDAAAIFRKVDAACRR
jgi:dTDP-4-amino-4,6-dideoxygalactose transaminase